MTCGRTAKVSVVGNHRQEGTRVSLELVVFAAAVLALLLAVWLVTS